MLKRKNISTTRCVAVTAMLAAVSFVLQLFEFPLPFLIPSFVKMDFSDLPALIGAFSMGPIFGVLISLLKNVLHLFVTSTGGVGELANFLLSASFSFVAGTVYHFKRNRKGALLGSLIGAFFMAIISVFVNYYITYPVYFRIFAPEQIILDAYRLLLPSIGSTLECLLIFNAPFTLLKGLLTGAFTFLLYKRISPLIKGKEK